MDIPFTKEELKQVFPKNTRRKFAVAFYINPDDLMIEPYVLILDAYKTDLSAIALCRGESDKVPGAERTMLAFTNEGEVIFVDEGQSDEEYKEILKNAKGP